MFQFCLRLKQDIVLLMKLGELTVYGALDDTNFSVIDLHICQTDRIMIRYYSLDMEREM